MKTLKSIQKNQEQLNSLLMEKWEYKKLQEQHPVVVASHTSGGSIAPSGSAPDASPSTPLEQDSKWGGGRSSTFGGDKQIGGKERPYSSTSGQSGQKSHLRRITEQEDLDLEDMDDEISSPDVQSSALETTVATATPTATVAEDLPKVGGKQPLQTSRVPSQEGKPGIQEENLEELLEEDHNCRSAHPGMNHDQWIGKYR